MQPVQTCTRDRDWTITVRAAGVAPRRLLAGRVSCPSLQAKAAAPNFPGAALDPAFPFASQTSNQCWLHPPTAKGLAASTHSTPFRPGSPLLPVQAIKAILNGHAGHCRKTIRESVARRQNACANRRFPIQAPFSVKDRSDQMAYQGRAHSEAGAGQGAISVSFPTYLH